MNLDKAALKMALAQNWGRNIEEIEEKVKADLHRVEGTQGALKQAAAVFDSHRKFYQDATDALEITGDECAFAMKVISRCVGSLQNLLDKATLALTLKQGELQGVRRGITMLEREFTTEQAKVEAVAKMAEYDGRPTSAAAADLEHRREEARAKREGPSDAAQQGEIAVAAKKKAKKKATKKATKKAKAAKKKKKGGRKAA